MSLYDVNIKWIVLATLLIIGSVALAYYINPNCCHNSTNSSIIQSDSKQPTMVTGVN